MSKEQTPIEMVIKRLKRYDPIRHSDMGGWDYDRDSIKGADDGEYVKLEDMLAALRAMPTPPQTLGEAEEYLRSEGIDPEEEREYGMKAIARLKAQISAMPTTESAEPVANEHLPMLPIEVGDILVPKAKSVAVQFPKGARFIVTALDGEKFHVCQFPGNHHGYWWKEHADDQQFAHWVNPKAHPPKLDLPRVVLTVDHYNIIKERMIEEHRKYGDALRPGHWAEIAARKVASHLADFGYLAPAKPFPVDEVMEVVDEVLDEDWDKRRADEMRARLTARFGQQ